MYFIIFLATICIVYIKSFKGDFTEENINKITPVFIGTVLLLFIPSLILSILNKG